MPLLTAIEITKIRFHINQVAASFSDHGDIFQVDCTPVTLAYIQGAIARCESAYALTSLSGGVLQQESQEVTKQNIVVTSALTNSITTYGDRTKTSSRKPSYRERVTAYHVEVERLSFSLGLNLFYV